MSSLDEFSDILLRDEPLAPYTWMKLGGPAQFFLTPRDRDQLIRVLQACARLNLPVHILGGGSNVLVREEGVGGAVIRLSAAAFAEVSVEGSTIRAGAGVLLSHVISEAVRAGLAGLENLSGIPGTLGGALCGNAGGRQGEIAPLVKSVTVVRLDGEISTRSGDDLAFAYRSSDLAESIVLEAELALQPDDPNEIANRLRKIWILKKSTQPLGSQSAGCIFKNPSGASAGAMIDKAGLKGTRIGGAEVSDRHANFIITHEDATSADVLRLIDLIRSKVAEQFGVHLELEIKIW